MKLSHRLQICLVVGSLFLLSYVVYIARNAGEPAMTTWNVGEPPPPVAMTTWNVGEPPPPVAMTTWNVGEPLPPVAYPLRSVNNSLAPTRQLANSSIQLTNSSIQLTIRMTLQDRLLNDFFCSFLRSTVLFWNPSYGPILVILDEEDRDKSFDLRSLKLPFKFVLAYEAPPKNVAEMTRLAKKVGRPYGYYRMFYSSYLTDLYTTAPVIAWSDVDAIFTVPITNKTIFRGGKLIVKGTNTFKYDWVEGWNSCTMQAIGKRMPADFMTYFPAYIFPDTIKNCREHIMRRWEKDLFEEAFYGFQSACPSQSPINVILSYAYWFENDRYDWHLDIVGETLSDYNRKMVLNVKETEIKPESHQTVHERHYKYNIYPLEQAICYVQLHLSSDGPYPHCSKFKDKPNFQLFEFQNNPDTNHVGTWCKTQKEVCIKLIREVYADVKTLFGERKIRAWPNIDALNRISSMAQVRHKQTCKQFTVVQSNFSLS